MYPDEDYLFYDSMLLQEDQPKRTLFILDNSISSKLFFLRVQYGLSLIDPMLLQEETETKLTFFCTG